MNRDTKVQGIWGTAFLAVFFTCCLLSPVYSAGSRNGALVEQRLVGKKEGVSVVRVTYLSDGLKVKGFLFLTKTDRKLPCVIFCHDGIAGVSKEHRLSSIRLAREGFVVFSPSYRGEDGSEGQVEIAGGEVRDVLNALEMLAHVKQADTEKIAIAGASHGALIAIIAASRSSRVDAVVEAYGVMNIYTWWRYLRAAGKLGSDGISTKTYGKGPTDKPQAFAMRNGVSFARRIKCPVLILHGKKDSIVPPEQAECLKSVLDSCGIPNEMKIYSHCAHGFLVYVPFLRDETVDEKERTQTEEAWELMLDFLDDHLKKK